jgi:hypothetical protein
MPDMTDQDKAAFAAARNTSRNAGNGLGDLAHDMLMFAAGAAHARQQDAEYRRKSTLERYTTEQILGKALGFPTEGPEVGGDHTTVCLGEATGCLDVVAQMAANRIQQDAALLERCVRPIRDRLRYSIYEPHSEYLQQLLADIAARKAGV